MQFVKAAVIYQSNSPPFFQFGNMSNKLLGNDEETQPSLFIWVSTITRCSV